MISTSERKCVMCYDVPYLYVCVDVHDSLCCLRILCASPSATSHCRIRVGSGSTSGGSRSVFTTGWFNFFDAWLTAGRERVHHRLVTACRVHFQQIRPNRFKLRPVYNTKHTTQYIILHHITTYHTLLVCSVEYTVEYSIVHYGIVDIYTQQSIWMDDSRMY